MHDSLLRTTIDFIKSPLKNYRKYRSLYVFGKDECDSENGSSSIIWPLKGVTFQVRRGEVIGIIGRNGAGKSTLLKILSRVTDPTGGRAEIHGRVSSLLEVGTGFHPELTGRENVYLNGTILGMRKVEIDRKFDEIVDFSEIEKFIDTPVKRYSSGMKVRLAFSVAAHLEPEILLIDEVLAVGDARFQQKCLNKMEDVGHEGRTVFFVSHNMLAVSRLCERVILIEDGRVQVDDAAHKVISYYLCPEGGSSAEKTWSDPAKAPGNTIARLHAVRVKTADGIIKTDMDIRKDILVEQEFEVLESGHILLPSFQFFNDNGLELFATDDLDPAWRRKPRPAGRYVSTAVIPGNYLAEGTHFVFASLTTVDPYVKQFFQPNVVSFKVVDSFEGDAARGDWPFKFGGVVRPYLKWSTRYQPGV
ncbi:MAG: ABC transporter ATP-binding protein [Desulfobacteraceae bacterium]|nr:MAG: ABC transporter ATP-binding protein [Desulfobacteraceae bacterium]